LRKNQRRWNTTWCGENARSNTPTTLRTWTGSKNYCWQIGAVSGVHHGEHPNIEAGNQRPLRGVPHKAFMAAFDGFEQVERSDLPKIIDSLHIADATTDEFKSRFRFREIGRGS
jgi:hypothetical protein